MSDPASGDPDSKNSAPEPPSASDALAHALGNAARRAGLDPSERSSTGHVVWHAIGGWRGIVESVLPSFAFLVLQTTTKNLLLSIGVSVGIAVLFTAIRLISRTPASAALGGLIATGAAAALSLWTGRAQDNFVWGFITNGVYGSALLVSALLGWSLIGLAAGYLMGEGTAWRDNPRKRRVFFWLAIAWAGLFVARLAVQLPLYFIYGPDIAALGTFKLIMGLPLFAPMIAVTWLAVRALYRAEAK